MRQLVGILCGHQETRDALGHDFGSAPDRSGHHGQTRRHRLQDEDRQPFGSGRQHCQVRAGQKTLNVLSETSKHEPVRQPGSSRLGLQNLPQRPVTEKHEARSRDVLSDPGRGGHQEVEAFLRAEAPGGHDDLLGWMREESEELRPS